MAQPIWVTPAGSLGTIPEGIFFQVPLQAYEPESSDPVYFQIVAGDLPRGIQVTINGLIEGVPQAIGAVQGVPGEVAVDVTSKFAVRAYTTREIDGVTIINRLADRTFTLTVTGQDAPEFITPPGQLEQYIDGTIISYQILYTDNDPDDVVIAKIVSGQLPSGLTFSRTGLISGYINPITISSNYEFTVELSDGKNSVLRTFSIYVWATADLNASSTLITADNTFLSADGSPVRIPVILTPQGSIGMVRNDNFFAFRFLAADPAGDQFEFQIDTPPPGLTLDPGTGWLYGYIPDLGQTVNVYDFTLRVYKTLDPLVISSPYDYSLTITGNIDTTVTWLVDSNLGSIDNGSTSTLYVLAESANQEQLFYRLLSGSDSSLPQGLTLLPTGEIAGRVSFNTFALDGGTTTFDVGARIGETTFDLTFNFTVQAYSLSGQVNVTKTFTIHLVRAYNKPYENLYIQAMPPLNDRELINSLLTNTDIFPEELIYRPDDPNFGVATNVIYDHAFGLTATTLTEYVSSLDLNHYWKNLVLGSIETAQALDDDGNVLYEVVYSRIIDNLVNNSGESVSKEETLAFPILAPDSTEINTVFPNSLVNMRDQVIDVVGQISNILPRWMLSKQPNGQVLGFTPAWVICYTKSGRSGQIAYNIQTQFTQPLNLIDFKVDRYELGRLLTKHWDPAANDGQGSWIPSPPQITTFDLDPGPETIFDGGSLQFIVPVDMYSNTDEYDKYLVFPKRNILE